MAVVFLDRLLDTSEHSDPVLALPACTDTIAAVCSSSGIHVSREEEVRQLCCMAIAVTQAADEVNVALPSRSHGGAGVVHGQQHTVGADAHQEPHLHRAPRQVVQNGGGGPPEDLLSPGSPLENVVHGACVKTAGLHEDHSQQAQCCGEWVLFDMQLVLQC